MVEEHHPLSQGVPRLKAVWLAASLILTPGAQYTDRLIRHAAEHPDIMPFASALMTRTAEALEALERYEESVALLQEAMRLNPSELFAGIQLGRVFTHLQRYDDAARAFRAVIQEDCAAPAAREAARLWDVMMETHTTPEQRVAAWRDMAALLPNAALPLERYIVALVQAERFDEAATTCADVRAFAQENALPLTLACLTAQYRLEQTDATLRHIEEIASQTTHIPEDIVDHIADTAGIMLQEGQYAAAERLLLAAETLQPANLWHQVRLGDALAAQERYEDALERYRRVLRDVPDSPYTAAQVDRIHDILNDPEARLREWETLTALHPESEVLRGRLKKAQ